MLWPVLDTSRLPVRQRGHLGVDGTPDLRRMWSDVRLLRMAVTSEWIGAGCAEDGRVTDPPHEKGRGRRVEGRRGGGAGGRNRVGRTPKAPRPEDGRVTDPAVRKDRGQPRLGCAEDGRVTDPPLRKRRGTLREDGWVADPAHEKGAGGGRREDVGAVRGAGTGLVGRPKHHDRKTGGSQTRPYERIGVSRGWGARKTGGSQTHPYESGAGGGKTRGRYGEPEPGWSDAQSTTSGRRAGHRPAPTKRARAVAGGKTWGW